MYRLVQPVEPPWPAPPTLMGSIMASVLSEQNMITMQADILRWAITSYNNENLLWADFMLGPNQPVSVTWPVQGDDIEGAVVRCRENALKWLSNHTPSKEGMNV